MRIRQIRPEFFTDSVTARWNAETQLTYIGLWCVADDAGWFVWNVDEVGAMLYPYLSVPIRTRRLNAVREVLTDSRRLTVRACGCATLPTLTKHQRIGGNKSFTVRDQHRRDHESGRVRTGTDLSTSNVTVGNVTVGNGMAGDDTETVSPADFAEAMAKAGLDPTIGGPKQ